MKQMINRGLVLLPNRRAGFTLIELLVVIAIIGILASVVLVSLNSARDKANDGSASASMSSIRAAAEIYYDDNIGSYLGVCTDAQSGVPDLLTAADTVTGGGTTDCEDTAAGYAAEVLLGSGNYFCVDSSGKAAVSATEGVTATDDVDCP